MRKIILVIFALVSFTEFVSEDIPAKTPSHPEYLIMESIGPFLSDGKGNCGRGAGYLAAVDHFNKDHEDITCETGYYNIAQGLAVDVQVTQHAGVESDQYLLHELDSAFRDKYGMPTVSYYPWQIDSQTVLIDAVGGREYRWLSDKKVISIQYDGSLTQIPEPLKVIKAYLAKHPSTLPAMTLSQLRSVDSKALWVKDEMSRRLWLCDKWFDILREGKTEQETALDGVVKSMNVFLDYREKYYSIRATNDKNSLRSYLNQKDSASIQIKLKDYKAWWTANKEKLSIL